MAAATGRRLALLAILAVALGARTIDLSHNPPGLFCDEAAIGWDATCIWKTGHNQYGARLPMFFPTIPRYDFSTDAPGEYSDYRGPLFIYSCVPSLAAFGSKPFAVRFTAAAYGTLAVLATYLFAAQIFGPAAGLIASALLAITPWAVHTSRLGIEWWCMAPLTTLGAWAFLRGVERGRAGPRADSRADSRAGSPALWWIASGALFGVALYGYSIARLFAPLMMIALSAANWRAVRATRGQALAWVGIAALVALPMALNLRHVATRFHDISIFNAEARRVVARGEAELRGTPNDAAALAERWPYNSALGCALAAYAGSYSPRFLFLRGDRNPRHAVPGFGMLYWFEAVLLIVGAVAVARNLTRAPWAKFLAIWAVVWPIPAALTATTPNAIRALSILPLPQVIEVIGALACWRAWRGALGARAGSPAPASSRGRRGAPLAGFTALALVAALAVAQVPRYFVALFRDFPREHGESYAFEQPLAIRYSFDALASGRCARVLASPMHLAMDNTIAFLSRFDPKAFLAGERPAFWVGRPTEYTHDTLLYLTPFDFLKLPVDEAVRAQVQPILDPDRDGSWFLERVVKNATPKIETIYRSRDGSILGFFIRADDALEAWRATHLQFVEERRR